MKKALAIAEPFSELASRKFSCALWASRGHANRSDRV